MSLDIVYTCYIASIEYVPMDDLDYIDYIDSIDYIDDLDCYCPFIIVG